MTRCWRAHRRGYQATRQNGEGTLFSRRINFEADCVPELHDSRLIVAIPQSRACQNPRWGRRGMAEVGTSSYRGSQVCSAQIWSRPCTNFFVASLSLSFWSVIVFPPSTRRDSKASRILIRVKSQYRVDQSRIARGSVSTVAHVNFNSVWTPLTVRCYR